MAKFPAINQSWLFNLVDAESQRVEESWTLVIPPRQYRISEGTRAKITKTFQRLYIDDYGPDNPELTISGFSGTSTAFQTWRAVGGSGRTYRGDEAFYTFRDTILHYRYRADYERKLLHVHDLADGQSYNCHLNAFTLDRSHEAPFRYPYSIDLFVINRLDEKTAVPQGPIEFLDVPPEDALLQAGISLQTLPKGVSAADEALLDFLNTDKSLKEFTARGGTWRVVRREVERIDSSGRRERYEEDIVLDVPEGEYTDAELVAFTALIRQQRRRVRGASYLQRRQAGIL